MLDDQGRAIPVFDRFCRDLLSVPAWVKSAEQRTLDAALAATPVVRAAGLPAAVAPTASAPPALYKLSYYLRIVRPATVSSSVTVTIRWTDGGIAQSFTFAAVTGNTTDTVQNVPEILIRVDPGTEVTIETAYASVGAEDAAYDVVPAYEELTPTGPGGTKG